MTAAPTYLRNLGLHLAKSGWSQNEVKEHMRVQGAQADEINHVLHGYIANPNLAIRKDEE